MGENPITTIDGIDYSKVLKWTVTNPLNGRLAPWGGGERDVRLNAFFSENEEVVTIRSGPVLIDDFSCKGNGDHISGGVKSFILDDVTVVRAKHVAMELTRLMRRGEWHEYARIVRRVAGVEDSPNGTVPGEEETAIALQSLSNSLKVSNLFLRDKFHLNG